MGTSSSINPGVINSPLWQDVSTRLNQYNSNPNISNARNLLGSFITASGGSVNISKGRSKNFGKAGVNQLYRFLNLVSVVSTNPEIAFQGIGITDYDSLSNEDLINKITFFLSANESNSFDNTSANLALNQTIEMLLNRDQDIDHLWDIDKSELIIFYLKRYFFEYFITLYYKKINEKDINITNLKNLFFEMIDSDNRTGDIPSITDFLNDGHSLQDYISSVFEIILSIFEM
ncbi:MAG: hypothetical protein KAT68_18200 [Bacteroidales bacterium]|nr:hypothetical protein [Bacteroidales bacterium]